MTPGDRIAHYEIVAKLGQGGMGAVYRAHDTKLNREVAIKVLPDALANDPDYLARFTREAQVLASLNHPNIAIIHGVEEKALVMELVPGQTLEERIGGGPIPLEEALGIARQLAEALEAAHEKGVIHRDLKPANVKVTPEGVVKVLDFGLAKAPDAMASAAGATMSPTLTIRATQVGVIMGTAGYMAPEQAAGKPVDRRADIWSFGVVLYEMLSGKMLFTGETVSHTLASVLKDPIHVESVNAPASIQRLLERCLDRNPKERLRDIGEARIAIRDYAANPAVEAKAAGRGRWIPLTAAAVALLAAEGAWLRPRPAESRPVSARFTVAFPAGTSVFNNRAAAEIVPSPDGRSLAFVALDDATGKENLWVRQLSSLTAQRLDKAEGAHPFWSPDSQSIGFFTPDKLKRVAVSGGSVQTICDVSKVSRGSAGDGGTWNRDGVIVFAEYGGKDDTSQGGGLKKVPAAGGVPTLVTRLEKDEVWHSWPQFLPDGRHMLYFAVGKTPQDGAIYVQELGSSKRVLVAHNETRAAWASPGFLLFLRENTLFAQRMNSGSFQLEGEPLMVAEEVTANRSNGRSGFAVSETGVLAYLGAGSNPVRQLIWHGRDGGAAEPVGKPGEYASLSLSPDAKKVALLAGSKGTRSTLVMDVLTGVLSPMTRDGKELFGTAPIWSPDGEQLALGQVGGGIRIVTVRSGALRVLTDKYSPEDWSPDGRSILGTDLSGTHVVLLSVEANGKPQTILESTYLNNSFRFSPDGKYVAYTSFESGTGEVYVASFPSFAVKRKISTNGGGFPVWTKGGKEVLYGSSEQYVMSVEIHLGSTIEGSVPRPLFRIGGRAGFFNRFAATSDGARILVREAVADASEKPQIAVVLNWAAEMR